MNFIDASHKLAIYIYDSIFNSTFKNKVKTKVYDISYTKRKLFDIKFIDHSIDIKEFLYLIMPFRKCILVSKKYSYSTYEFSIYIKYGVKAKDILDNINNNITNNNIINIYNEICMYNKCIIGLGKIFKENSSKYHCYDLYNYRFGKFAEKVNLNNDFLLLSTLDFIDNCNICLNKYWLEIYHNINIKKTINRIKNIFCEYLQFLTIIYREDGFVCIRLDENFIFECYILLKLKKYISD